MKKIIGNTFTVLMAAFFLVATSGMPVFHHSCNTQNTSEYTVLFADFSCEHWQGISDAEKSNSCCADQHNEEDQSCEDNHCCDTETLLVKLDANLDFNKSVQVNTDQFLVKEINVIDNQIYTPEKQLPVFFYHDLPPPLTGKDLKIYLHQLNIPHFVV